jgi:hypothetical protein
VKALAPAPNARVSPRHAQAIAARMGKRMT